MKILPKKDSRDLSYHNIEGQISGFIDEYEINRGGGGDKIQPFGNIQCTCYDITDIAWNKDGIEYQIDDLFDRVPQTNEGVDPKKVIKTAINDGLLPIGGAIRSKPFNSYFTAHTSDFYDAFDAVRSSLVLSKRPVMVWSPWYQNWHWSNNLIKGDTITSYHAWNIEGWKQIKGETYFIIEAWVGAKLFMSREVFNDLMTKYGSSTAVLSDEIIDAMRKKTLLETLRDTLENLVILYQQLLAKKKVV